MKFLIFNLVIAAALIYLVTGGDLSRFASSSETAHQVTNAAKVMVDRGQTFADNVIKQINRTNSTRRRDKNGETTAIPAMPEPPALHNKVVPPIAAGRDQRLNNSVQTPTAPVKKDDKKPIQKTVVPSPNMPSNNDPDVLRRRAEVLAEGPVQKSASTQRFMSPRDRRRELHALTEEMELLFAQNMAR